MSTSPIPGGLLIAVEGIDGAGKTTVARALADFLRARGVEPILSKEPTAGRWGQELRNSALTGRLPPEREAELLVLDRQEHVESLIAPALSAGKIVILDRYFPSMVAYQGAEGLPPDDLLRANDFAPRPDLLLLLDLPPAVGLERIRARGDAPNTFETADNLTRCRAIFRDLQIPGKLTIDAQLPLSDVIAIAGYAVETTLARKIQAAHADPAAAVEAIMEAMPSLAVARGYGPV